MALAQTVDTLDKVPESQRAWYAEADGKFVLDLNKVEIDDASALKKALNTEREAVKQARAAAIPPCAKHP